LPQLQPDGSTKPSPTRSLEGWWCAYQNGGFAALHPKARFRSRRAPATHAEQEQLIVAAQVKAPTACFVVQRR